MYDAYKGTRHPMPEELREQVPVMKDVLQAMNVPLMSLEGFEADDLIGTVSLAMEQKGLDVRIISGDRDLLQLASDTTMVRIPKTKKEGREVENYYAGDVKAKYLVSRYAIRICRCEGVDGRCLRQHPGDSGRGRKDSDEDHRGISFHSERA